MEAGLIHADRRTDKTKVIRAFATIQKTQKIITLETNDVPNIKDRCADSVSCYIFPSCTKLFVAVSGPKLAQR